MTYSEFIKKYEGKAIDVDGSAGVQCVDLSKAYLKEVFGIPQFSVTSAKNYFEKFSSYPQLVKKFDKISNTPSFIPMKGDICVFNSRVGGGHGHVSIATGEGTTTYFYSHDMNWNGKACKIVKHKYLAEGFLGVLRPKDRSVIVGETSKVKYYPACAKTFSSLVDALQSIKVGSSFTNRKRIANANGISDYSGTAQQNTKILELLKAGKLIKY